MASNNLQKCTWNAGWDSYIDTILRSCFYCISAVSEKLIWGYTRNIWITIIVIFLNSRWTLKTLKQANLPNKHFKTHSTVIFTFIFSKSVMWCNYQVKIIQWKINAMNTCECKLSRLYVFLFYLVIKKIIYIFMNSWMSSCFAVVNTLHFTHGLDLS